MFEYPFEKIFEKERTKEEQADYKRGYDDYMREHSASPYEQGRQDAERDLARRQMQRQWRYDRQENPLGYWYWNPIS